MIPRIKEISAQENFLLKILFDDGKEVLYDLTEDINQIPAFFELKTQKELFKNFILDESRTVVSWTDLIELPSDTLYEYGKEI